VTDPEFLYLTTRGRRTGQPREIEIWFTRLGDRYYVIAEHGERAQWVRNLLADSRIRVRVADDVFPAAARAIDPAAEPDLARVVREGSREKYGWGEGLIVEVVGPTSGGATAAASGPTREQPPPDRGADTS
jgi:deazaflavin-dependent oxidoreductase (nitroreductase family)